LVSIPIPNAAEECSTMIGARKLDFLAFFFCLVLTHSRSAYSFFESYEADLSSTDGGISLLQVGSKRALDVTAGVAPIKPKVKAGIARKELPVHVYELGLQVLGSERVLDAVVANTVLKSEVYSGEHMTFRMPLGDGVDPEDGYGLDSLGKKAANNGGMINMVDIGGNLGRVSIAAFKKNPRKMRIVVVEPVPSTYFLLRWNLWLNNIPQFTLSEFKASPSTSGVVALQNGIADVNGQKSGLCYTPPATMSARICNCSTEEETRVPKEGETQCFPMIGNTIDYFLNIFGGETISFLKMDCEGCEKSAIPSLMKQPKQSAQRILTFAGELHAAANELEDFACKFEGGRRFVHVCFVEHPGPDKKPGYQVLELSQRCERGKSRESCTHKNLSSDASANLFQHA